MTMYRKSNLELIELFKNKEYLPPYAYGLNLQEAYLLDEYCLNNKNKAFYDTLFIDDPLRLYRVIEP